MRNLVAWFVAILLTSIFFWPVIADPIGRIVGGTGDPLLVTYLFTWVADNLASPNVWHPPFLFPDDNVLTYSDHVFGLGTLSRGLSFLGVPPVGQFNLFSMLSFVGVFMGLFLWSRENLGRVVPSLAAAALGTFTAHRWGQLAHLQVHCLPLFVFALWGFERGRRSGRVLPLWYAGLAVALQIYATPSMALYFVPILGLWLLASTVLRVSPGWTSAQRTNLPVIAVAIGAAQAPWVLRYHTVHGERGLDRPLQAIREFSAQPIDWISAAPSHWLYDGLLTHTVSDERELFPGILLTVLIVVAMFRLFRSRNESRFAIAASFVAVSCLLFMAGPSDSGGISLAHLPYDLLALLPGLDSVRVPTRFLGLAGFFFVPALSELFGFWETGARTARRRWIRTTVIALSLVAIVEALPGVSTWDFLESSGLEAEAFRDRPSSGDNSSANAAGSGGDPRPVALFLPLPEEKELSLEIRRMWKARHLEIATANGYSGHTSLVHKRLRHLQAHSFSSSERDALHSWLRHIGVTEFRLESGQSHAFLDPTMGTGLSADGDFQIEIPPGLPPEFTRLPVEPPLFELTHGRGWSVPEEKGPDRWTWSVGGMSQLWIPLRDIRTRTLRIRARTLATEAEAELVIQWNGKRLGRHSISRTPGWIEIAVPRNVQRTGWNDVFLIGPTAVRPADLDKKSKDRRRLSLCVHEIVLD